MSEETRKELEQWMKEWAEFTQENPRFSHAVANQESIRFWHGEASVDVDEENFEAQ